jgi:hypothetical protein
MNVMLHTVISDITGATGRKIVRDIVAGQHDPEVLAAHRDSRCHASRAEIVAALTGNYRAEHLFSLRLNFAAYQFHLEHITQCDAAIEALLNTLAAQQPQPAAALPPPRRKSYPKGREPRFEIRTPLHRHRRRRPQPNRRHRPAGRAATSRRDRHRHESLENRPPPPRWAPFTGASPRVPATLKPSPHRPQARAAGLPRAVR